MERRYILNAIDAALQAGEKILSIYDDPASDFQVEKKADNSPLTIADRKAHETICRLLADTHCPLLSEEGKHLPFSERRSWETLWIVDPLDGTKEFIKRNGEFSEYSFGASLSTGNGSHLCAGKKGALFWSA